MNHVKPGSSDPTNGVKPHRLSAPQWGQTSSAIRLVAEDLDDRLFSGAEAGGDVVRSARR